MCEAGMLVFGPFREGNVCKVQAVVDIIAFEVLDICRHHFYQTACREVWAKPYVVCQIEFMGPSTEVHELVLIRPHSVLQVVPEVDQGGTPRCLPTRLVGTGCLGWGQFDFGS